MRIELKRLVPYLLLAAGILGATGISLLSSRSLAWALAGPLLLAATVVVSRVVENRLLSRSDSTVSAFILAATVLVAGAVVAVSDPASVSKLLPILGACAVGGIGVPSCRTRAADRVPVKI
jgi:hypothetical protein